MRGFALRIKRKNGTYDAHVCGELVDATHRPVGRLKQELDEPEDEAQWAYVSILCQEDVRYICHQGDLTFLTKLNTIVAIVQRSCTCHVYLISSGLWERSVR
jgi:hypothetical protein